MKKPPESGARNAIWNPPGIGRIRSCKDLRSLIADMRVMLTASRGTPALARARTTSRSFAALSIPIRTRFASSSVPTETTPFTVKLFDSRFR